MKAIVLVVSVLFSTAAMAFVDMPSFSNSDFPSESNWAKFRTGKACGLKFSASTVGQIKKFNDGSVLYTVKGSDGKVLAAATAKSDLIVFKANCEL